MRSDSPPPSWYEPPDVVEPAEQDLAEPEPELFTLQNGIFWWTAAGPDDDE